MQRHKEIIAVLVPGILMVCSAYAEVQIGELKPTVYFPNPAEGEAISPLATLSAAGVDPAGKYHARVTVPGKAPCATAIERWYRARRNKKSKKTYGPLLADILVPDIQKPCQIKVELLTADAKTVVASKTLNWQPQKKYTIYFVSTSHHDLGFGDYPHPLRTRIRHANISGPLEYCRKTDSWDHDDQYRFQIETAEPLTSFIAGQSPEVVEELAGRIREGRIQIGALHNTANTEQLSHECMARLFYLANRHACDLLNVPASNTGLNDDTIGLTWPLATFCQAAGVKYVFHGYNPCRIPSCMQPGDKEPVFHWQGPDGGGGVLMRHEPYGKKGDISIDRLGMFSYERLAKHPWPYDVLLMTDISDYAVAEYSRAKAIRDWNAKYAYPRVIYATMDMFFDAIAKRKQQHSIRTLEGDANNEWASMDSGDARLLADIRRAGELVPAAEKFSAIAASLTSGGYPWTDIYQAYHRMLAYVEHTDGAWSGKVGGKVGARYYETELEENREMGRDALFFGGQAMDSALDRLCSAISTDADRTLAVFNQLERRRTDLVRAKTDLEPGTFRLVDAVSGKTIEHQQIDGELVFLAQDVPALGYKTFRVETASNKQQAPLAVESRDVMENQFYKIRFDRERGGILSIHDKQLDVELVDNAAPRQFGEYLYKIHKPGTPLLHRPEKAALDYSAGPVTLRMDIRSTIYGARELRQRVILYKDLKRIDFQLDIDKEPCGITLADFLAVTTQNKESAFICLPFKVPGFTIRHELPGATIDPYRQQLSGCTSYFAVRHFSDMSNDKFGVTVSAPDSSLMEYGHPRSFRVSGRMRNGYNSFGRSKKYPEHSRMYLYLMNNMWDMNTQIDQPGPHRFRWSVRSHAGNWQAGKADQFGWNVHNPLMARIIKGRQKGILPADRNCFVRVEPGNVVCTTIKQAEHNGAGLILRLVETGGKATDAEVTLPFLGEIDEVRDTSLVEVDKDSTLAVKDGHSFSVKLRPFGVRTIRILSGTKTGPAAVTAIEAKPVSDIEVSLSWRMSDQAMKNISHFNLYRCEKPHFKPTLLHLVQRSPRPSCVDRPILHYAGWINNRLKPDTAYYYRIEAVDRRNNRGPLSQAVSARTMKSSEKNTVPLRVEQLIAILVSPLAPYNLVNLLFRTSCESDVAVYEIHRSTQAGFSPGDGTRIGQVRSDDIIPGAKPNAPKVLKYGVPDVDYPVKAFDHAMFADETVKPETTYYYKVCAVDSAGQKGAFSNEAMVRTGQKSPEREKANVRTKDKKRRKKQKDREPAAPPGR